MLYTISRAMPVGHAPGSDPADHALGRTLVEGGRMTRIHALLLGGMGALVVTLGGAYVQAVGEPMPMWAYGVTTPPKPTDTPTPQAPPTRNLRPNEDPAEQTRLRKVEGSTATYALVDVRDGSNVIDWFPGDHPPMTPIIKNGPPKAGAAKRGCGSCHLPNGRGRPENAPISALPVSYFIKQLQDFRDGLRPSADLRKPNNPTMAMLAAAMTDAEMKEAAEYFASFKFVPWTRVVETTMVPETEIEGNLFVAHDFTLKEPINGRIIEVPQSHEQANLLRNPRSGFITYVPPGSIKRGEDLVKTGGNGKTIACGICHGADLMGTGDIPGIGGRSASYMVRQMYDMQQGLRRGSGAMLMKQVVANLTPDDYVAIAAYVTSVASQPNPATTGMQPAATNAAH